MSTPTCDIHGIALTLDADEDGPYAHCPGCEADYDAELNRPAPVKGPPPCLCLDLIAMRAWKDGSRQAMVRTPRWNGSCIRCGNRVYQTPPATAP